MILLILKIQHGRNFKFRSFLGKTFLCVINRYYLTSRKKYEDIQASIDLVIHDECHSIENKTTQQFYEWWENHQNQVS